MAKKVLKKAQKGGDSTNIYNKYAKEAAFLSDKFEKSGDVKGSNMAMDVMIHHLNNAARQKLKNKPGYDAMGHPVKKKTGGQVKPKKKK